ncbi:MAG TPA: TonB family protein [candidate division Zixibacteria bacterium]|nr:TonB family protein [candidate division Zixibacteria bacterium]
MNGETIDHWEDLGLSALLRSPFLWPSIAIHLLLFYLAVNIRTFPERTVPSLVPIQLLEVPRAGSPDKSIGPGRGPGGPKSPPKLGQPVAPRPSSGSLARGQTEAPAPVTGPTAEPQAPVLAAPKTLAGPARSEPLAVRETAPESLVQLPTRAAPGSTPAVEAGLKSDTTRYGPGTDIRALREGARIPGALKGMGSGAGSYGVPGGSRSGVGIAGSGTGTGTGGGSRTGLGGAASADYNQYLKQVERRVNSMWRYPDGVTGVQKVTVRFTLDRAGKLAQAEVLDSSDPRLNASALEAMRKASPFPPIPESLKELAGEPLIIRFTVAIRLRG